MWEIRENMGSYSKHKYDEYEYGYEAGYRDAMKELRGAKKGMEDDEDEEEYKPRTHKIYR